MEKKEHSSWSQQINFLFLAVPQTIHYVTFHFDSISFLGKKNKQQSQMMSQGPAVD